MFFLEAMPVTSRLRPLSSVATGVRAWVHTFATVFDTYTLRGIDAAMASTMADRQSAAATVIHPQAAENLVPAPRHAIWLCTKPIRTSSSMLRATNMKNEATRSLGKS